MKGKTNIGHKSRFYPTDFDDFCAEESVEQDETVYNNVYMRLSSKIAPRDGLVFTIPPRHSYPLWGVLFVCAFPVDLFLEVLVVRAVLRHGRQEAVVSSSRIEGRSRTDPVNKKTGRFVCTNLNCMSCWTNT